MASDSTLTREATGTVTEESLDRLEIYGEKNLRADEQADLIEGTPPALERGAIYLIAAALFITILILYLGKVDVVVEAKGKILPLGDVMTLQVGNGGVVLELRARPGDRLRAGAPIAVIDTSETGVSLAQLKRKLAMDEEQLQLHQATLNRLDSLAAPPRSNAGASRAGPALTPDAYQLLNTLENAEVRLQTATEDERLKPERERQLQEEHDVTRQRIAMLERNRASNQRVLAAEEETLGRKKEQLQNVRKLAENKLLSVVEFNTEEERYRAAERSLMQARQQIDQLDIDVSTARLRLHEVRNKLDTFENESGTNMRAARVQYDQALASLRQGRANAGIQIRGLEGEIEGTKLQINLSQHRMALATITMPVEGTVAELKIRNRGEIVAAGAPIATIVPAGVPLMVEAAVADKDVAFLRPGVAARVKVEAFPFQQFGTARGRVLKVLPTFTEGTGFRVQLALLDNKLSADHNEYYLYPGLAVSADLITSRQRLLGLLLQGGDKKGDKK